MDLGKIYMEIKFSLIHTHAYKTTTQQNQHIIASVLINQYSKRITINTLQESSNFLFNLPPNGNFLKSAFTFKIIF